jgi:hypothetical protein
MSHFGNPNVEHVVSSNGFNAECTYPISNAVSPPQEGLFAMIMRYILLTSYSCDIMPSAMFDQLAPDACVDVRGLRG